MGAKSYGNIVMDFQRANVEAERLDGLSRQMLDLANERFGGAIRGIDSNWKGENASAYIRKCNRLKERLIKSSGEMKRTANTIRTIARNTYNAEMRAWRIAQTRSAGSN